MYKRQDKARSPKAVQDTAKLEEIKKLYMQLKQDPTTDPEKLKKVKAFLLATKASSQPEISKAGQGDPPSSSKDKAKGILKDVLKGVQDTTSRSAKSDLKKPNGQEPVKTPGDAAVSSIDELKKKYMKLKADPKADPTVMQSLKETIKEKMSGSAGSRESSSSRPVSLI